MDKPRGSSDSPSSLSPCLAPRRTIRRQGDSPECFDLASDLSGLDDFEPSLTRQEFADDADLNVILARYGAIPASTRQPMYGDYNTDLDLVSAYEAVERAKVEFSDLPHSIRKEFGSWAKLAQAIALGEYDLDAEIEKLRPEASKKPAGGVAGVPPDASTADPAGATAEPAKSAEPAEKPKT